MFVLYFLFQKLFNLLFGNKSKESQSRISEIIIYGFIIVVYLTLLIWNAIEIVESDTGTPNSSIISQQTYNGVVYDGGVDGTVQSNQPFIPLTQVYIPPNYQT